MKAESIKLETNLLNQLRALKDIDGRPLKWHLGRAIRNYLIAKKSGKAK